MLAIKSSGWARAFITLALLGSTLVAADAGGEQRSGLLDRFIPNDVTAGISAINPDARGQLCRASEIAIEQISSIQPADRVAGLNSIMDNADKVPGFRELDRFGAAMSEVATAAYVTDNDQLKQLLVDTLGRWALAGAYLKTRDCSTGNCKPSWQDPKGHDLAPDMDHSNTVTRIMQMALPYYAFLADYRADEMKTVHRAIDGWFSAFAQRLNNRNSRKALVYFGNSLGWNWPNLLADMHKGDAASVERRLKTVARGLDSLVLADGSLKDRTTRGDRAMWYHFATLDEVLFTLEILKANGSDLYPQFADRLHKAVKIFLDAGDDPAAILPWAKQGYHNGGDGTHQDFTLNDFKAAEFGSSWVYIYMHRYPDTDNSRRLRKILSDVSHLQSRDAAIGLNVGCIYRVLDAGFRQTELTGKSDFEASIAAQAFTFSGARVAMKPTDGDPNGEDYKLTLIDAKVGDSPMPRADFGILADYPNKRHDPNSVDLLRLYVSVSAFLDDESRHANFAECGDLAYSSGWPSIRLHFGSESSLNACILRKLGPRDRTIWYTVFTGLDRIFAAAAKGGNADAQKLIELYMLKSS